jgi:hypothetical protein
VGLEPTLLLEDPDFKSVTSVFRQVSRHPAKCRICRYFVDANRLVCAATYRCMSARLSPTLSST